MNYKTYALNKPYGYLSQFTVEHPGQKTLSDLLNVDKNVYPIGRLDKDSEGLLLLSSDPKLNSKILSPHKNIPKTYWVQVEGVIKMEAAARLEKGVEIRIKKKTHHTQPCSVWIDREPPEFWHRTPPIRYRKNQFTSWACVEIHEGKNRQIRRMFAAISHPVLRLIRWKVGRISLANIPHGGYTQIVSTEIF